MAIAATDERAWGRAWHTPSSPALSAHALAERLCALAGAPAPRLNRPPAPIMLALQLINPVIRELKETRYQFDRPFVVDSSAFETTFGMTATSLDQALEATIEAEIRS